MYVTLVLRDNCVEQCRVSEDYETAAIVAVRLMERSMSGPQWFEFVQGDHLPSFKDGEWYSHHGLKIGVVEVGEMEVFI